MKAVALRAMESVRFGCLQCRDRRITLPRFRVEDEGRQTGAG
jgi:hypothetical protein